MSAEAKNLEAITKAIIQHNGNCEFPVIEIRMNPFEVERLGWTEIRGIPIKPDDTQGTGSFRLVCDKPDPEDLLDIEEEVQLVHAGPTPESEDA